MSSIHPFLYIYKEGVLSQTWQFKDVDNTPVFKRVSTKWLGGDEILSESWTGKTLARYRTTLLNSMLSSHGEITLRGETTSMTVPVHFTGLSQSGVAHKFQYNGLEYIWRQGDSDKSLAICTVKTEESNGSDIPKITKNVDIMWYKETEKKCFLELNHSWISNAKDSAQLEILLVMTYCLFAKSIEPHKDSPVSFKFLK